MIFPAFVRDDVSDMGLRSNILRREGSIPFNLFSFRRMCCMSSSVAEKDDADCSLE